MAVRRLLVLLLVLGAAGCSPSVTSADDLARRLEYDQHGTVVDVAAIREETGEDLDLDDEDSLALIGAFAQLPHLQLARFVEAWSPEDLTGYASTGDAVVMRFAVTVEEMADRMAEEGYVPGGERLFVPGDDVDGVVGGFAEVVGLAEDGDGVLVAAADDDGVVAGILDGEAQIGADAERLLELGDDAVRYVFPGGLDDGGCRLVALTQSIVDDRLLTAYLEGAEEDDLSDRVEEGLRGDLESVEEVDGLLAVTVEPEDEGLIGIAAVSSRFGAAPICR